MCTTRSICLLLCILALGGCYESLVSIATPDKLVFYDDLVGEYKAVDPATGRLTLERGKEKEYAYKQYDDKDALQNKGTLKIIKLRRRALL